jgi:hypothetical protein
MSINELYELYRNNQRNIENLSNQNNHIMNQIIQLYNNSSETSTSQTNPFNTTNSNTSANFNTPPNFNTPANSNTSANFNTPPNSNTFTSSDTNRRYRRQNNIPSLNTIFRSFLDPVPILPTQQQIQNSTRTLMYCDIMNPINTSCPISLENFNDSSTVTMIRHCRHLFNSNSLSQWFRSSCLCPICRYDIRNFNNIQMNDQETNQTNNQDTNQTNNQDTNQTTNQNNDQTNDNPFDNINISFGYSYYNLPLNEFDFRLNNI